MARKKKEENGGYNFKPREYDRDERIELQKIVTNIPVTRKLLSQELLVKATFNYVNRNIKIGSTAAHHVNTTNYPQLFFSSLKDLVSSTENLVKIEKFWRFEGKGPTEQLEEINNKREAIIMGFVSDSFMKLLGEMESKRSASAKQKLFNEYQAALMQNIDMLGEDNFDYFKELCRKKLNIIEEKPSNDNFVDKDCVETDNEKDKNSSDETN